MCVHVSVCVHVCHSVCMCVIVCVCMCMCMHVSVCVCAACQCVCVHVCLSQAANMRASRTYYKLIACYVCVYEM